MPHRNKYKYISSQLSFALLLAVVLTLLASIHCAAAQRVPQEVLDARKSVVRICAERGAELLRTGTGFVTGDDNGVCIITNRHVIKDTTSITIYYGDGKSCVADVVSEWAVQDLALLQPREETGLSPLPLAVGKVGDSAYSIGFPGGADSATGKKDAYTKASVDYMTLNDGIVSSLKSLEQSFGENTAEVQFLQTNSDINAGNSGGPLLNEHGAVIGINTLTVNETNGMGFAVSTQELFPLLNEVKLGYFEYDGLTSSNVIPKDIEASQTLSTKNRIVSPPVSAWIFPAVMILLAFTACLLSISLHRRYSKNPSQAVQTKSTSVKKHLVAAVPILAFCLICTAAWFYTSAVWNITEKAADKKEHSKVTAMYEYAPWIALYDPYRPLYYSALTAIDESRLSDAKSILTQIREYRNCEKLLELM